MEPILAALVFPRLNEYLGILLNSCLGVWLVGGFHFLLSISMTRIPARCKVHQILSMLPWWFSAHDLYQISGTLKHPQDDGWLSLSSPYQLYLHIYSPFGLFVQSRFQLLIFSHGFFFQIPILRLEHPFYHWSRWRFRMGIEHSERRYIYPFSM